jgi:hypothetical protein
MSKFVPVCIGGRPSVDQNDDIHFRMTVPPALPIELECTIFEIAAVSWPRLVPKFMLVAWRVKTWLVFFVAAATFRLIP